MQGLIEERRPQGGRFFNEFKKMHYQLCIQPVSMLKERSSDTDHISDRTSTSLGHLHVD